MTTIPAPTKTAPVIITLTIILPARIPENPSVADLLNIVTRAKAIATDAAKHGAVTGTLSIGKQKYKLEEESPHGR